MTASKRHLTGRIIALRRQKLSYPLIAQRLGCSSCYAYLRIMESAPELLAVQAEYTIRYHGSDAA